MCYHELDEAFYDYAEFIAIKYRNKAKLSVDVNVDKTAKIVTITFSGTGYTGDGAEDDLSRIYVFDVDEAGVNKLPKGSSTKRNFFSEL